MTDNAIGLTVRLPLPCNVTAEAESGGSSVVRLTDPVEMLRAKEALES